MIKYICTKCRCETDHARSVQAYNNFVGYFCDDCYNGLTEEEKNPTPDMITPLQKIFGKTPIFYQGTAELYRLSRLSVEGESAEVRQKAKEAIDKGYRMMGYEPCVKCGTLVPDSTNVTESKLVRRQPEKMGDCDYDRYCPSCYKTLSFEEKYPVICFKCGARSGDDWRQCGGQCPVEGSPYYDPNVEYVNYKEAAGEPDEPGDDDVPF